ncbi:MAG: hypothetical protein ABL311_04625 [Nitratireductor rhodophyticola]|uniref:hypothetical protein n=1 Tax=Nitratireductor rhodophyticola TaxID=2854036 RepID=UPI0032D8BDA7
MSIFDPVLTAVFASIMFTTTIVATAENFASGDNPWPCMRKGFASGALAGVLAVFFKIWLGV